MLFYDNLVRSLSWSFIHSLWQGLILTIIAALVMICTKKSAASIRYSLLCALFFLFLGSTVITFIIEWTTDVVSDGSGISSGHPGISQFFHHTLFQQLFEQISFFLDSNSQWIVFTWMMILAYKTVRMGFDMAYIQRLRRSQLFSAGDEWKEKMRSLSHGLGIKKKVALLESALIRVPVVVGHFKPIVLMPVGILANLPAGEVEAVLLHELAHIRRNDYLVNFIQRIAELLFFFNPALLWVSSLLRIERENCCDDIAIIKTNNKLQFVEALISFKEHSVTRSGYALGLFGKKNLLLQRMTRIVYNRNNALNKFEFAFFGINLLILLLLVSAIRKPDLHQAISPLASVQQQIPGQRSFSAPLPDTKPVSKKTLYSGNNVHVILPAETPAGKKHSVSQPVLTEHPEIKKALEHGDDAIINNDEQLVQAMVNEKMAEHHGLTAQRVNKGLDEAESSRQQAAQDRLTAEKDRAQAELHRQQAERDRAQADLDRLQAEKDRQRAEYDRAQAEKDRARAEIDRKKAEEDRQKYHNQRSINKGSLTL